MSECGPPLCRICGKSHWSREPHILPANAKGEARSSKTSTTNGADTNCRTLRTDPRTSKGVPGTEGRGMNGQREVSRQGIVRPTHTEANPPTTKAEKVRPGKPKTAPKKKRKWVKK